MACSFLSLFSLFFFFLLCCCPSSSSFRLMCLSSFFLFRAGAGLFLHLLFCSCSPFSFSFCHGDHDGERSTIHNINNAVVVRRSSCAASFVSSCFSCIARPCHQGTTHMSFSHVQSWI